MVQCYLDMEYVDVALKLAQKQEHRVFSLELQAEPLWRLGQWEELDSVVKKPELSESNSWGVQIGRALLHFRHEQRKEFENVLEALRLQLAEVLSTITLEEGIYQHGYRNIVKLHALNELQKIENMTHEILAQGCDQNFINSAMEQLTSDWDLRLKVKLN